MRCAEWSRYGGNGLVDILRISRYAGLLGRRLDLQLRSGVLFCHY